MCKYHPSLSQNLIQTNKTSQPLTPTLVHLYMKVSGRMLCTETSGLESNIRVAKSEDGVSDWRDFGFNLCVAPFPNVNVPNFKLEDLHQSHSEVIRVVGGSEVQMC